MIGVGIGIGSYIILPSLFNYIVANYKRNKTIKKIKDCLNEKGYIVDKRMEKEIVERIIVDYDKKVIPFLEKWYYITVDEEKKKWVNDRNNALKILEKKYDDDSENNKENVMEIYENDNLEQLKLKRKMLDEMIELKKSQKENDNILEKEIKKQNNDVELDNLSLKYTPDKKKKN